MKVIIRALAASLLLLPTAACVSHSVSSDFNGVNGMRGVPVEYQTTTTWSMNGLFVFSLWGNASKAATIGEFTKEASANGATRTRITQTSSLTYWFIFPPLSFFIHPVRTTVEGDVEAEGRP